MWQAIMTAIQNLPAFTSSTLLKHQYLLLSSLRSRHKSIANDSLDMWNRTFGSAESLEYPDELHLLLTKLQPVTDLILPTFPDNEGDEVRKLLLPTQQSEGLLDKGHLIFLQLCRVSRKYTGRSKTTPANNQRTIATC